MIVKADSDLGVSLMGKSKKYHLGRIRSKRSAGYGGFGYTSEVTCPQGVPDKTKGQMDSIALVGQKVPSVGGPSHV